MEGFECENGGYNCDESINPNTVNTPGMRDNKHFFLHEKDTVVGAELFDPQNLSQTKKRVEKHAGGRGGTVFFHHDNCSLVLRHYCRGGLPARLSRDKYLWAGLEQTRAWREYALLKYLQTHDLPAPRVYAAHVEKWGLFYSADILTHCIEDTDSLGDRLVTECLSAPVYERIGATICRFHRANIDHVDLNAHNLLIDQKDRVYLIDFDKCRVRKGGNADWREGNLQRLRRSLVKLRSRSNSFHFSDADWDALQKGYASI